MRVLEPQRVLSIDGTFNFRDLGGYPTVDGRQTRWRTLFRSGSLHNLSPDGQQQLVDLGVRTLVDLRYPAEVAASPCVFAVPGPIEYRSMPLIEDPQRETDRSVPELDAVYRLIVGTRQAQLVAIVEALASRAALPAVVNCTAGKDRTGVVVAFILSLVGVRAATIIEDYASSGPLLVDSGLDQILRARIAAGGGDPAQTTRLLASPPEYMHALLDHIHETYGGVESLALEAGLDRARIAELREALLE